MPGHRKIQRLIVLKSLKGFDDRTYWYPPRSKGSFLQDMGDMVSLLQPYQEIECVVDTGTHAIYIGSSNAASCQKGTEQTTVGVCLPDGGTSLHASAYLFCPCLRCLGFGLYAREPRILRGAVSNYRTSVIRALSLGSYFCKMGTR